MPIATYGTPLLVSQLGLTDRVGVRGKNVPSDVIRIQDALNAIPAHEGTPEKLLTFDGVAGPLTCDAIQKFQLRHFGWKLADGRVDPGGKTEAKFAELLGVYGSRSWNIKRVESKISAPGSSGRTINSLDRFFVVGDPTSARRALFYFTPLDFATSPRADEVPPLQEASEFNMFQTSVNCGVFSFVGDGTYSEFSPSSTTAMIQLVVTPVCAHITTGTLPLQIRHTWLEPTTTPGVPINLAGTFSFVRDESQGMGARKTPRRR